MKMKVTEVLFSVIFFALVAPAAAQQQQTFRCLSPDEAKKVIGSIASPSVAENKKLRRELLEMRREREKLDNKIELDFEKNRPLIVEANKLGETNLLRVCRLLKENGWIAREAVGDDGFNAFAFLMTANKAFALQRELLPVLSAAAKKGLIRNHLLANLVDNIRIGSGAPQIFGTQATIRNDIVYLYPLLNEEKVDEWRKLYDLPPLAAQIREMEDRYILPVLKSPRPPRAAVRDETADQSSETAALGISDDEAEVLKIDTRIVNLNLRVLAPDLKTPPALDLTKADFAVAEDGVEQEIVFFSAAEKPFDLVLLLDFSGSTLEKRDLIKRAAQRFVEATRDGDRVSVVAFTDEIRVVSELTGDKASIVQKIREIEMDGGSAIWDAFQYVSENIIEKQSAGRRTAIVFMTDGEDGSQEATFADVMETVRRGETTVFPVYLQGGGRANERFGLKARRSLSMLAEESGGQFYRADDAKDLTGVYEQVASDLGKIYSVGYEPKNEARDGAWRNLSVRIKTRPDLTVKTRRGYYAN